jgi:hypothetical protein
VGISKKFLIVYNDVAHSVRLVDGYVLAEFADHESAVRAAKARGWRLGGPQPDPPAPSVEAVG